MMDLVMVLHLQQAWAVQVPEGKQTVQNNGDEMTVLEGIGEKMVASETQSISSSPPGHRITLLFLL